MNTTQILEKLSDLYAQRDLLTTARKEAIPAEIRKVLDDIEAEFAPKSESIDAAITETEAAVKAAVLSEGQTSKGGSLQAVFTKGRITWDSKALDGLMTVLPQIAPFRKQGEPSVSIRRGV